nr:MAG TPA: hypothetical protein [Caudoviricetes sp.]
MGGCSRSPLLPSWILTGRPGRRGRPGPWSSRP